MFDVRLERRPLKGGLSGVAELIVNRPGFSGGSHL